MNKIEPKFINGYWRAVVRGEIQPTCYNTYQEAAAASK